MIKNKLSALIFAPGLVSASFSFAQCFDNTTVTITQTDCIPCDDQTWVLKFEDNFDRKELGSKNWEIPYQGVLAGYDFSNSGSKTWYANTGSTPSLPPSNNIAIENGVLKLIARKESSPIAGKYVVNWGTNPPTKDSSSFQYSSVWVDSKGMLGYGKYETRIKIPTTKGIWPAFWLYGANPNEEFDIFEMKGKDQLNYIGMCIVQVIAQV